MATWWRDPGKLIPDLFKNPTRPGDDTDEEPEVLTEDIGSVGDDESDEFDDVELPDRGTDDFA
jgi:hypothetical protein